MVKIQHENHKNEMMINNKKGEWNLHDFFHISYWAICYPFHVDGCFKKLSIAVHSLLSFFPLSHANKLGEEFSIFVKAIEITKCKN